MLKYYNLWEHLNYLPLILLHQKLNTFTDYGSFWSFRSDTQMNIILCTEFLLKKMICQKTWLLWKNSFSSYGEGR